MAMFIDGRLSPHQTYYHKDTKVHEGARGLPLRVLRGLRIWDATHDRRAGTGRSVSGV
jgi:hypothetical protein